MMGRVVKVTSRNIRGVVFLPVDIKYNKVDMRLEFWACHSIPLDELRREIRFHNKSAWNDLTATIGFQGWSGNREELVDVLNTLELPAILKYWEDPVSFFYRGADLFLYPDPSFPYPSGPINDFRKHDPILNTKIANLLQQKTHQQVMVMDF